MVDILAHVHDDPNRPKSHPGITTPNRALGIGASSLGEDDYRDSENAGGGWPNRGLVNEPPHEAQGTGKFASYPI